jgi:hypothetical protein
MLRKSTGASRLLMAALMTTILVLPPVAYADEPPTAQVTQTLDDSFASSSTDQGRPAPESPGENLGNAALTTGITTAVTLAVELAFCAWLGACVFAGF